MVVLGCHLALRHGAAQVARFPSRSHRFLRSASRGSGGHAQPGVAGGPGSGRDAAGGEIGLRARTVGEHTIQPGPPRNMKSPIFELLSTPLSLAAKEKN